jgi:hypothetical protein
LFRVVNWQGKYSAPERKGTRCASTRVQTIRWEVDWRWMLGMREKRREEKMMMDGRARRRREAIRGRYASRV